jgi:hypothetical protein
MAKFTVKCYFTYCGETEVEAESIKEAKKIGYNICSKKPINELNYVGYGYTDIEVQDETGETHLF